MAGIAVRVLGTGRLIAKLNAISVRQETAVKQAVNQSVAIVEGEAKSLAPVDTNTLRGSIKSIPSKKRGNEITGGVSTSTEYAPYVEFGTGVRGASSTHPAKAKLGISYGGRPGQKAQPFMYPALRQNKNKIKQLIKNAVKSASRGA